MEYLRQNGVGSREFYPPLHSEPAFLMEGSFPATEEISGRGLWLPSSLRLTDGQVEKVCELVLTFLRG
jgi:perosamine synthetase